MEPALNPELWHEFAVMVGGAFAALAGLLVVSMSINIEQILDTPVLTRRGGASLMTTISPLVTSIFILVPRQPAVVLGWELVVLGIVLAVILSVLSHPMSRSEGQTLGAWLLSTGAPTFVLIGGFLLAGIGVLTDSLGGLYWLVPAIIAALIGGVMQAWVLLIEIRR